MRVFAVSDIHIDYEINARWITELSSSDYQDDVLILAGDVTDDATLLGVCLESLAARFKHVLFVPGNHDLWVFRDRTAKNSLDKFADVARIAASSGASMTPLQIADVAIYPLLGWYDYSFGEPGEQLRSVWMDYRACRWPEGFDEQAIATHFAAMNDPSVAAAPLRAGTTISFSHFLPRIDLMPQYIPAQQKALYPVLGGVRIEDQLRALKSSLHVYGHSHVNRSVSVEGVSYINNALGYPNETNIASRGLLCIHEC